MEINTKIRRLDVFKKVPQDLSEGTNIGGLISILTILLIGFFTFNEIKWFMYPETTGRISFDTPFTRNQMTVQIDITFPRFPCEIISLDLQDVMMSHHPNIGSVRKWRLDSDGKQIDTTDFQLLREPNQKKQIEIAKKAFQSNYGCRLIGSFSVKEVPGNFHISSHAYQNIYVRLAMDGVIKTLDVSHQINHLYFGDLSNIEKVQEGHKQAQLTSLNGHSRIYNMSGTPHSYTSHYHLDIVPTSYSDSILGLTQQAYQFTYNHNTFEVTHMPSLYFNYHIGGLKVIISPPYYRVTTFLLEMCAILGGVYTIARFIDHMVHQLMGSKQYVQLQ